MRIIEESERTYYQLEAEASHWSVRELDRQINSGVFQRLLLSTDKKRVKQLNEKGQHCLQRPLDAIKDPYVLEFLNLDEKSTYSESQLEQAIIDKLEHFLLELGKASPL